MKWPSKIPATAVRRGAVTHMDILPTLAAAAGTTLPENLELDGQDLVSGTHDQQELFWRNGKYRTYRQGDWKLHWLEDHSKFWRFDLANDPLESRNLAAAEPERGDALMATLRALDEEQVPSAWPIQLEIPLSIDKTLESPLLEGEEYVVFSN